VDCDQPMRFVCRRPSCEYVAHSRCRCADERKCGDCSERQRKLLVRLIMEGSSQRVGGHWYMATFTAPGDPVHKHVIPGRRGFHGWCDCGKHGMTPGEWNAQESKCWNRLRTALTREFGALQYVGTVEVQGKRRDKMLHRHVLVWSPVVVPMLRVHALAQQAGYGCSIQWEVPRSAQGAASYVAKYITKSSGQREEVPWEVTTVDMSTGELLSDSRRATYRTWSRSQRWGVTMGGLREVMSRQAAARARYFAELENLLAQEPAGLPDQTAGGKPDAPSPEP